MTAYLGVFPGALIQGHAAGHEEPVMHGGVPLSEHAYHVMAAVFDAGSGRRLEDATRRSAGYAARSCDRHAPARSRGHRRRYHLRKLFHDATAERHEPVLLDDGDVRCGE